MTQNNAVPLVNMVVAKPSPTWSVALSPTEISHFEELVQAGRIIAILAWADSMVSAHSDFKPVSREIDFLCKTLNLHGLMKLATSLQAASVHPSGI